MLEKTSRPVGELGLGVVRTIGTAKISVPFPDISVICEIPFHITEDENCPSVLCLRDSTRSDLDRSVQNDRVHCLGKTQKPVRENGLFFYGWNSNTALFSHSELFRLYRSSGHPSVSALDSLLRRACPCETSADGKKAIAVFTENCQICSELERMPKRFRLIVGKDDSRFNHFVAVDIT